MKSLKLLFVSNGHFEDMMACQIIKHLKKNLPFVCIKALPLVGEGKAYISEGIPVLGPCKNLPSEGLIHFGFKYLLKDIKAGLIPLFIKQIKVLRKEGKNSDFIVAVGDIFLCALCGFFSGKKIIFASTAQSIYIRKIDRINIWLMKHFANVVFPRDEKTHFYFKKFRIPSVYFGSLAMDCIDFTGEDFNIPAEKKVIGLLPGRRKDAFKKLYFLLEIVNKILEKAKEENKEIPFFIISLSFFLNIEEVKKEIGKLNWKFIEVKLKEKGIIGYLVKDSNKIIVSDKFGDVINKSNLIIGFSGAANEQAIGLGKPVITFPVKGNLYPWYFFEKIQKKLLGGYVFALPFDIKLIAEKIFSIIEDPLIEKEVKKIGLERVGPAGAGKKIALYIKNNFIEP
ncbi:MAG TPA: lipid-A-disaccharide synthase-related protein [bacterium]|nr:lipid-A-disaccharide synthase-related protein [bacterium]